MSPIGFEFCCSSFIMVLSSSRTHCTLYVFITDYIKDAFLAQLHMETAGRLEQATKALDQWKTVKDPAILRSLKVSRPVLQVG